MKSLTPLHICFALISCLSVSLSVSQSCSADNFNLANFDIDGARIGDRQKHFLRDMSAIIPAKSTHSRQARSLSLLYKKPISCQALENGVSRCKGKFAEMQKPADNRQKEFISYRDVVADFNQNSELAFLSTITTTRHKNKKSCLKALSKYYTQATSKTKKPSVIYPRNQLDIYYIRIDEEPFTTRMVGKLDSAFTMVWQKKRGDWSAFYSLDFGCRESGHMVVNKTLYDESRKKVSSSKFQVSSFKTQD